ncbi:MAG: hypothetical protein SGJ19_17565 [Planctomycetia bacterium]|nr:hypothetical protein [Planctomycetia bacterium]
MTEERIESKKKKADGEVKATDPVMTIREGAVAASIWRRQSPSGYAYYDFSLSRSWKSMSSGKTGCSQNFFGRHDAELHTVIERATEEIRRLEATEQAQNTGAIAA